MMHQRWPTGNSVTVVKCKIVELDLPRHSSYVLLASLTTVRRINQAKNNMKRVVCDEKLAERIQRRDFTGKYDADLNIAEFRRC